jgi:quercetin dioxygenase-like cupin family protein
MLGTIRILAGAAPTRGQYFMFESETAPSPTSAALDVHAHAAYDESEYVVSGTREIVIEDRRWGAGPGFFALAPRQAHHGMRTIGATPSRWVHFFSPAGIEAYFLERERLREQGASAEALGALSAQHGAAQAPHTGLAEAAYASEPMATRDGRLVVTGRDTRDAYAIVEWSTLTEEVHSHDDQEEGFYVITGEIMLEMEGGTTTATTGSFLLVPRGVAHRHITASGSMVLAVYSPGHAVPHRAEGAIA